MVEACVLLFLLVLNTYFVAWDDRRRHAEIGDKAQRVIARLDRKCHFSSFLSNSLSYLVSLNWSTWSVFDVGTGVFQSGCGKV